LCSRFDDEHFSSTAKALKLPPILVVPTWPPGPLYFSECVSWIWRVW
jgi:hypothetical protein